MHGKVLITGGLGNLGSYITKELCEVGYDVYVLTKEEKNIIKNIEYTTVKADISNLKDLKVKLKIKFDFCIHLASSNNFFIDEYPKKALNVNTLGTRNLLEVLSKNGLKKFVYFSTFHVYGVNHGIINENKTLNPINDYASTHLFAEYYVKQFCANNKKLKYSIFRLTNSYGAPMFVNTDKWYLILNDLVKSAYERGEILLKSNGEIQKDFIWVKDVAHITNMVLNLKESNIYNLSSNKSYKIIDIANLIKIEYDKRYDKVIKIIINKADKNIYKNLVINNNKLKSVVKFKLNDMLSVEINKIFDLLESK